MTKHQDHSAMFKNNVQHFSNITQNDSLLQRNAVNGSIRVKQMRFHMLD